MDDQQVIELLKRAVSAVDASGAPEDLREAAFAASIGLLSGDIVAIPPVGAGSLLTPPLQPPGGEASGSDLLDRIASELGVEASKIAKVFKDHDGLPEMIIKSNKLPGPKSQAAADVALLIMGARQAAGIDEFTEAEVLREACKQYSKFDSSNFAAHLKALDSLVQSSGKGQSMLRKLTKPGREAAAELIEKYTAEA